MINYIHNISVEDYNLLRRSVGWKEIEANQAQTGLIHSAYLIVAESDSKPVGLARLVSDGGYIAIIVDVIVLPEYQGKGIGKSLMKKVIDFIKSDLKEGQTVFVNLMSAKGKEAFYKKLGFTENPSDIMGSGMVQFLKKEPEN
jgi:GNAT superfamily N-acetyltransferase